MWFGIWWVVANAAPPENVDLSLIDKWNDGAEAMLDGTAGCWELVGHAKWNWQFGRFGETRGEAIFAGRLEAGIWKDFHLEPLGEFSRRRRRADRVEYHDERHFSPLVGRLPPRSSEEGKRKKGVTGAEEEPRNVLRRTLEEVGSLVSTSWASWEEERGGVLYHTAIPVGEGTRAPEVEVVVFFPGGGDWATEQDVKFPEHFRLSGFMSPTIEGATVKLRATVRDNKVFPTAESFRFGLTQFGFHMTGAQTIEYTHASRCSGW
jgi:hypothetical protein